MPQVTTTAPDRRGAFWRMYVGAWAGLAIAATSYLGVTVAQPELMAGLLERGAPASRAEGRTTITADAGQLRGEVDGLKADIAEIRSTVGSHGPAIERMAASIDALRQGTGEQAAHDPDTAPRGLGNERISRGEAAAQARAPAFAEVTPTNTEAASEARIAASRLPPLPTRAPPSPAARANIAAPQPDERVAVLPGTPRVLNQQLPAPAADLPPASGVTTGSLPRPALRPSRTEPTEPAPVTAAAEPNPPAPPLIRFGAPVVTAAAPPPTATPAGAGTAVRLSSGGSLASLRISWQVLRQLHGAELGDLEGRYRIQGSSYQLLAGPFADRQQADHACSQLRAKNVSCSIDTFGGNAL